MKSYY